jgi:hypothetical protein
MKSRKKNAAWLRVTARVFLEEVLYFSLKVGIHEQTSAQKLDWFLLRKSHHTTRYVPKYTAIDFVYLAVWRVHRAGRAHTEDQVCKFGKIKQLASLLGAPGIFGNSNTEVS